MLQPATKEAYQLLHDGALTLAILERNGIRIDENRLNEEIESTRKQIKEKEEAIKSTDVYVTWNRLFGAKTNIGSRYQLGRLLFEKLGLESKGVTATGRHKVSGTSLEHIHLDIVRLFLENEKLKKMASTYLEGIKREVVDGFLHPVSNLHTTITYRSSCDTPNFQNIPIRDPEQGKIIRSCFIPREGHRLIEIDYAAIEVRVAACYNHDARLIEYIQDETKDMHRDMAAECYGCDPSEVEKPVRYCAKNMFVFPQFYGSYWASCATNLWEAINKMGLKIRDLPIKKHLRQKLGIKLLGSEKNPEPNSFMRHIRKVEEDFWGKRFAQYAQWKKRHYENYIKNAGANTLTGFRLTGYYDRKDIINYPIQGSAFHCLLWSLIRIQRLLKKKRMRTLLVGQIHDCILADAPEEEVEEYVKLATNVMTQKIRKAWPWIIVPLEIEVEACGVGETWMDKKEI